MPAGRPRIWNSPEELQKQVDEYYVYCEKNNKPLSIAGLGVFLNVDRQTIYNYAENDEFFGIIKKARQKVIASFEERAIERGHPGIIFVMKNYGFKDTHDVNANIDGDLFNKSLNKFMEKL